MMNAISRAQAHDGVAPLSEQFLRGFYEPELRHVHFRAGEVGVLAVDPAARTAEMVVDPDHRRQGIGSDLLAQAHQQFPDLSVWAHGNVAAAQSFAAARGLHSTRELLVMAAGTENLPPAVFPEGIEFLPVSQRRDDAGFLKANNEAFSWHPEQGGWDEQRLHQARNTPWYRPEDDFLLWEDDTVIGFHWMKRHGDLRAGADGEVYVVGLANTGRGRGLGGPLVAAGLNHLAAAGAQRIILYVEADNTPAVRAYEDLGFAVMERHVLYGPA